MKGIKTILIVDDDFEDIEIFSDVARSIDASINILSAVNGEDALNILTYKLDPLPDMIILDLNMPRLNGKQCLERIKKSVKLRDIPVVMCSTSSERLDVEDAQRLGASSFITKASTYSDLRASLAALLAESDASYVLSKASGY